VYTTFTLVVQVKYKVVRQLYTLSTSVNKTIKDLRVKEIQDHNP